ncbi:hypothetical protein T484DRAFT_1778324, partial [Baffinella frigidus]
MEKRVRTEGGVDVMHDPALERIESDSGSRLGDHSFNPEIADITEQFAQRIDRLENSVEVATTTVADGMSFFARAECIILSGYLRADGRPVPDRMWTRPAFMEAVLSAEKLDVTLSSISHLVLAQDGKSVSAKSAENLDVTLSSISHLVKAASQVDNRDTIGAAL